MTAATSTKTLLDKYIDAVRFKLFQPQIRAIFPQIDNQDRRVFALQRFVAALRDPRRGQTWIDSRWAMTQAEFQEWQDSPDFDVQSRELRSIRRRFSAANPRHVLRAGSRFRSLSTQIDNWNKNHTVGVHAPVALKRAEKELKKDGGYPDLGPYLHEASGLLSHTVLPGAGLMSLLPLGFPGTSGEDPDAETIRLRSAAIEKFVTWLAAQRNGKPSVTVSTPGLSNHGVGQAVDFKIFEGGRRIRGASNPTEWRSSGWAERLADAVQPSQFFSGPLAVPDEPWHWTFDPTP